MSLASDRHSAQPCSFWEQVTAVAGASNIPGVRRYRLGPVSPPTDDRLERGIVDIQRRRQFVRRLVPALLRTEIEQAGVVAVVGVAEELGEARVDLLGVEQPRELADVL